MAAEDNNQNMPKLEASTDTANDPRIIINQDNPPHQQLNNYFVPAIDNGNNNADNNAFVAFNNGGHAQVDIPAPMAAAADDQVNEADREYFASFPPGYRFCPLDRELILHYLYRKVHDLPLPPNQIREVNLYRHTPDWITERYPSIGDNQWYFFTPRDKKYLNGSRPNRAAGTGFWKATGADKKIEDKKIEYGRPTATEIGLRKALVYYEGKPPKGKKTNWIMHEFKLKPTESAPKNNKKRPANDMRLDDFVLCKLYKKVDKSLKIRSSSDDGNEAGTEAGEEEEVGEVNGENGTHPHPPNFAPSQETPQPYLGNPEPYFHAEENGIRLPSLPPSSPLYAHPMALQQYSYHQTSYPYLPHHSRPELAHLSSFRFQPPACYPHQHHNFPPVSNSQVFISQPYSPLAVDTLQHGISDPQQSVVIDMKPQENAEYPFVNGYLPNDNSVGEYFVDCDFDNTTPLNGEILDKSAYTDSSSSHQKRSFDSRDN